MKQKQYQTSPKLGHLLLDLLVYLDKKLIQEIQSAALLENI